MGHALTYLVLVPDAHARTADLSATGHAYLGDANAIGLVAVIAALSVLFFRGLPAPATATRACTSGWPRSN